MSPQAHYRQLKIKSADGTKIYADALGDPSKPSIIFIHGASMSGMLFDSVFEDRKWSEMLYLVRYDVRGHGRSDTPKGDDSYQSLRLAEDFDAVVKAFNVRKPIVLGWSLGATSFADILCAHPSSYISGLINVAGVPCTDPHTIGAVVTPEVMETLRPMLHPKDVSEFQDTIQKFLDSCSDAFPYPLRQAALGTALSQPRYALERNMQRRQDTMGLMKAGKEGKLPLLIIFGSEDKVINGHASVRYYDGWKRLKVVELDGADHVPWISKQEEFRDSVLDWIKQVLVVNI